MTEDLEAGDVISQPVTGYDQPRGSNVYVIQDIDGSSPRCGTVKRGDTLEQETRLWHHNVHLTHLVVGGPKLEAARRDPTLLDDMQNWRPAPEKVTEA